MAFLHATWSTSLATTRDEPDRGVVAAADGDVALERLRFERMSVDRPRQLRVEDVGDGRKNVHGLRVASIDATTLFPRVLDEQRNAGDVGDVLLRRVSPPASWAEADAVVGRDDDQRSVVEARRLETVEHLTDEPVGGADL